MNVLSVDWDYFMDCSEDTIQELFPDGGNESIGISLSNFIWATHYAQSKIGAESSLMTDLATISVRQYEKHYIMLNILNHMTEHTRVRFADSHSRIFDLICNEVTSSNQRANVYNIDHHSDTYNYGTEVNAGNWVNHLDNLHYLDTYTWIKNKDTEDTIKRDTLKNTDVIETTDILKLEEVEKWDAIFICRSSIWTPPHLDKYFIEFQTIFNELEISFSTSYFSDRYEVIQPIIAQYEEVYRKSINYDF